MKYVETSRNDVLYDRDAAYDYNMNGSLKRETIGEDSVQGRDYTYTLLGQLKGINHPALDPAKDPGRDGVASTTANPNPNANVAKDAFGMAFHYHANDFVHTTNGTPSVFADGQPGMLGVAQPNGAPAYDLYSGQIGAWSMKTQEIPAATLNGATLLRNGTLVGERFRYDALGRLREDTTYSHDGTSWLSDGAGGWSASFRYDQNSNMRKVKRWAMTGATQSQMIDDAVMRHTAPNLNTISAILDLGINLGTQSLAETQQQQAAQVGMPYHDASGRRIRSAIGGEDEEVRHTAFGLPDQVTQSSSALKIIYGPLGEVARVTEYQGGVERFASLRIAYNGSLDAALFTRTSPADQLALSELTMVGLTRLGIAHGPYTSPANASIHVRNVDGKDYEHRDLSGSVRVAFSDVKGLSGGQFVAEVSTSRNYDVFGQMRAGTLYNADESYPYTWHGLRRMSDIGPSVQLKTEARLYDPRSSSWMSHDPVLTASGSPYEAMGSDPLNLVDPDGRLWQLVSLTRSGVVRLTRSDADLAAATLERVFGGKISVVVDEQGFVTAEVMDGAELSPTERAAYNVFQKLIDPSTPTVVTAVVIDRQDVVFGSHTLSFTSGEEVSALDFGDFKRTADYAEVLDQTTRSSEVKVMRRHLHAVIAHEFEEQQFKIANNHDARHYYVDHEHGVTVEEQVMGLRRADWRYSDDMLYNKKDNPITGDIIAVYEDVRTRTCGFLGDLLKNGDRLKITYNIVNGIITGVSVYPFPTELSDPLLPNAK